MRPVGYPAEWMQLPGRLCKTTLGDVLGGLYRERVTGVLELHERPGRVHRVHLERGLVRWVEHADEPEDSSATVIRSGTGFAPGGLRPQRLRPFDAERRPVRYRRLERLFALRDAEIRFRVPRPDQCSEAVPLDVTEFLFGRPRYRDQLPFGTPDRRVPEVARTDAVRLRALATLGLGPGATRRDVIHAFRELARTTHPDRHQDALPAVRAGLVRRFAEVSAAYHVLVA